MTKQNDELPSDEPKRWAQDPILRELWMAEIRRMMAEEYRFWRILSTLQKQNESDGSRYSTDSKTKLGDYIKISKKRTERTPDGKK